MRAEENNQRACLNYLSIGIGIPVTVIQVPNEAGHGKNVKASSGFKKGASDTILVFETKYTPNVVFCEFKRRKLIVGKKGNYRFEDTSQADAQVNFQAEIEAKGHTYWLAPSLSVFATLIEEWANTNGLQTRLTEASRKDLLSNFK